MSELAEWLTGRVIAAAREFVDAEKRQEGWGADYAFSWPEFEALEAALVELEKLP